MTNLLKSDLRKLKAIIDENAVTLVVTPAAGALPAGVNGAAYPGATIATSNPVGAAGFGIVSGSLPTGLVLNSTTGVISGTATETVAAKPVSIRVSDAYGNSLTVAYTITITAV